MRDWEIERERVNRKERGGGENEIGRQRFGEREIGTGQSSRL